MTSNESDDFEWIRIFENPLYLVEEIIVEKATEHLIGKWILPRHFNDDKLGLELDKYYQVVTTKLFTAIALKAAHKFQVGMDSVHLDGSSMYVHGEYEKKAKKRKDSGHVKSSKTYTV